MNDRPQLVYRDAALLVLEKPAGMPSASLARGKQETLAAWILEQFPEQARLPSGDREAGICHRLDNDTSGLVIAARTAEAYDELRQQFSDGSVGKEYRALVAGHPPERGAIDLPIAHHPRKKRKMVVCESAARAAEWKGRPAHTEFSVLQRFRLAPDSGARGAIEYALLAVRITTGVRHQIRCHLAHEGFPIAGDRPYQNPSKRAHDRLPLARHFLHCCRLTIRHPATGEAMSFTSPLPPDLAEALDRLTH